MDHIGDCAELSITTIAAKEKTKYVFLRKSKAPITSQLLNMNQNIYVSLMYWSAELPRKVYSWWTE